MFEMKQIILLPALVFSCSFLAQAQSQNKTDGFATKSKAINQSNKKTDSQENSDVVPAQQGFGTMSVGKNQANPKNPANRKVNKEKNSFRTKSKLSQEAD
jgi:hypothetical protein